MANPSPRTSEQRARLGRGLAALIGDTKVDVEAPAILSGVKRVPIEFVRSNPRNPRRHFDEADLDDLAASIQEKGIIQPIIVRPVEGVADAYEIIAGERRWRAAQRAGQHEVPILPIQTSDREVLELSIIENVQRADLSALEEAKGYAQLAAEYGYSHSDLGKIVGKSRSYIANTLRLLALPEHCQNLLASGAISAGHARALLALENPNAVAERIVAQGLTVRDVEKLSSTAPVPQKAKPAAKNNDENELAKQLSAALGMEVKIVASKRSHYIKIKARDLEQIDYVVKKIVAT